jgi:Family of unknown function (DUF6088)
MRNQTKSMVGRFVSLLEVGRIFTTREVLCYGFRAAIDQILSRFVKQGRIRRLARGVFVKDPSNKMFFSDFEIAKVKAESFGRRISKHPDNIGISLGIKDGKEDNSTFSIDGRTSRFRIGNRTITLKETSTRRMKLSETHSGQVLRALCQLGSRFVDRYIISTSQKDYTRFDRIDHQNNIQFIPSWLSDLYPKKIWKVIT